MNVDAVLLAAFAAEPRRAKRAVDLGAGVGAVGLCLLYRDRAASVVFVEREPDLSALCRQNLEASGWGGRSATLTEDLRDASRLRALGADLVVCNPPYVPPGRGRPPKVGEAARVGDLATFTRAARGALGARGRACFVYPAGELPALLATLREAGLEPKRLRLVHAAAERPARVALVEASAGRPGGLVVLQPLVERASGAPSAELAAILAPRLAP